MILKEMVNWRELFKHADKEDFNVRLGREIGHLLSAYPDDFVYTEGKKAFSYMEKENFEGVKLDLTAIKNRNSVSSKDLLDFSMGLIAMHNENVSLFDEFRYIGKEIEGTLKEFFIGVLEGYNTKKEIGKVMEVDKEILKGIDELDLLKPISDRELKVLDRYGDVEYLQFATKGEKEALYSAMLKLGEPNLIDTYTTVRAKLLEGLYVDNSNRSGGIRL